MKLKVIKAIMLTLLLASVLTVAFNVTSVKAQVEFIGPMEISAGLSTFDLLSIHGPRWYNVTTDEGLITLQVTNVTIRVANMSEMTLIKVQDGKKIEIKASNVYAENLMVYATRMRFWIFDFEGSDYADLKFIIPVTFGSMYMEAVYLRAESLSIIPLWLPGDVNGDGIVNIHDIIIAAKAFGSKLGDPNWNPYADLNGDDKVNIIDLIIILINFGKRL